MRGRECLASCANRSFRVRCCRRRPSSERSMACGVAGTCGRDEPVHPRSAMKLLHVVGARPNFPKLAPVHRAATAAAFDQRVVHTGQHYDDALSASFFRDLGIPAPDVNLEVGSDTHAVQTAHIMARIEHVMVREKPDWVLVYGDVNSTIAAALVA